MVVWPRAGLSRVPRDLRRVLAALVRGWVLVVVAAVGVTAVALVTAVLPGGTAYVAEIVIDPAAPPVPAEDDEEEVVLRDEIRRSISPEVLGAAAEELDDVDAEELRDMVGARQPGDEELLALTAQASGSDRAVEVVEAVADAYLEMRATALDDQLARRADRLAAQIDALRAERAEVPDDDPLRAALAEELVELLREQTAVQAAGDQEVEGGEVIAGPVSRAESSDAALVPRGLAGLFAGLVLGVALALVRDWLDPRLRDEDELLERAGDLPLLARFAGDQDGPAAGLRAALTAELPAAVLVVGAGTDDDPSGIAAALADTAARHGDRVLAVDADLTARRLTDRVGAAGPGLTEVLAGTASLTEAVTELPSGARLLAAGTGADRPSEPLARTGAAVLSEAAAGCDLLVVCGPAGAALATAELARNLPGVVLVVTPGSTELAQLDRSLELLGRTPTEILGLVSRSNKS